MRTCTESLYGSVVCCDICAHVLIDPDAGAVCPDCRRAALREADEDVGEGWDAGAVEP